MLFISSKYFTSMCLLFKAKKKGSAFRDKMGHSSAPHFSPALHVWENLQVILPVLLKQWECEEGQCGGRDFTQRRFKALKQDDEVPSHMQTWED